MNFVPAVATEYLWIVFLKKAPNAAFLWIAIKMGRLIHRLGLAFSKSSLPNGVLVDNELRCHLHFVHLLVHPIHRSFT